MEKLLDLLTAVMGEAFAKAGYDAQLGRVSLSNRPDLCEFQCNGAMSGAKAYRCAPLQIAQNVVKALEGNGIFGRVEAVAPGFLNLDLSVDFLNTYLEDMAAGEKWGLPKAAKSKMVVIDYGGANVAKPLHVGHIRAAVIGESIKRISRYCGHRVLGDVHLGDWGLQMGLVIMGLRERLASLPYFDPEYLGEYPSQPPFGIRELEEIYPAASARSKQDAAFKEAAMEATKALQQGHRGYRALWRHIMDVSLEDLRRNYGDLQVEFDLWKGESDVDARIPAMVEYLRSTGLAYESMGALVVDVAQEGDAKEIPPCMILKSDGASLYNTTDLATLQERTELYRPDQIVYVVDKRQELYFEQVFRCARKTGLVEPGVVLDFVGFGTMNGADGKPFKTRDGGVMRLENLIRETKEEMERKISQGRQMEADEAKEVADIVAVAALKYGDLSNQASKDYLFDLERFTSFEGDTGPYLLYTIVRIKSILAKYVQGGGDLSACRLRPAVEAMEKQLAIQICLFHGAVEEAERQLAPHKICAYVYDLANAFNKLYHDVRILAMEPGERQQALLALLKLAKGIMEDCIWMLGFQAPEKM